MRSGQIDELYQLAMESRGTAGTVCDDAECECLGHDDDDVFDVDGGSLAELTEKLRQLWLDALHREAFEQAAE